MAGVAVPAWPKTQPRAHPAAGSIGASLDWLLPVTFVIAALLLRVHAIDHESLWLDEGYTLLFSGLPFDRLIVVGGAHEHPPLYYSIVHVLRGLDDSYLVPRLVSVVAGAISVGVLYLLGRRLFGWLAGTIAALLLLVNPFHLWYSQDGRGYALASLLVLLSYLWLVTALDTHRTRYWVLYGATLALCLYAEYTTVFVLIPSVVVLVEARRRGQIKPMMLAWGGAALVFLPWLGVLVTDAAGIASDYWIPVPTVSDVAKTILEFGGLVTPCPGTPCTGHESPLVAGNEVLAAALFVAAAALAVAPILGRRDPFHLTLVLWLFLPFGIVLVLAAQRSLYLDRIFLDATFPLYLLLGAGAAMAIKRPYRSFPAIVLAGIMALASIGNLVPIYGSVVNPDWRSVARDLAHAYRPGQAVIFNPGVLRSLLTSYLPGGWHATYERPLWSRSYVDVPGWQDRYSFPAHPSKEERRAIEAKLRDIQFAQAASKARQIWLVTYDYSGMNDSRRWFSLHGYQLELSQLYFGDTRLELWDRRPLPSFGPAVAPDAGFAAPWIRSGRISIHSGVATSQGATSLRRDFPVTPGYAYSVGIDYRGTPPASKPDISVQLYARDGTPLDRFPRTMWYDWPVNGVWLSQPFGFVAPPHAVRAVLTLRTGWGETAWRHVAVYRER